MAQTLVNIRMDEELKKSMERTCQELGMNMTTAFTIFAKKMSRENRIPFDEQDSLKNGLEFSEECLRNNLLARIDAAYALQASSAIRLAV
jgi:addiction module RelB/DinJ family antitoxin